MRKDIIKNKIKEVYDSLELIEVNMPADFEKFQDLGIIKDGMYKRLEYAIENLIDVFYIIGSDINIGTPYDDSDMLEKLDSAGIITEECCKIMKNLKGFRNILVHRYSRIDDFMSFTFIKENIKDFNYVIECIDNIMGKH